MDNLNYSLGMIRQVVKNAKRPAAMLSFGKDSMVMADLIRTAYGSKGNAFPMDVIYHRDPWFPHKHDFADTVIQAWKMTVYDYPPACAGVKVKPDMLELVARYNFGKAAMDVPKNVCRPEDYPRRDFICGLNDWVLRPKSITEYPWDVVFHGHKDCDVDPFEGATPLTCDATDIGNVWLLFPLRHWSDNEIWDYTEANHIPTQLTRYANRKEMADKWYNNDYTHACTACIDPRETAEMVYCPKLKQNVKNRGGEVLQLHAQPDYWKRAA